MPKKKQPVGGNGSTKSGILDATIRLLRERRGADLTMDQVAQAASCAKGLVHYHFRKKDQLLAAAAGRMWEDRAAAWRRALDAEDPKASIGAAWNLLATDSSTGVAAACAALGMRREELIVQSVNSGRVALARGVTEALDQLLGRMGREATVPIGELGTLLAAIIEGIGLQLGSGAGQDELEQAWAAFWVGLLSLTSSRRSG
ncbi:MAG: TetR/AcrR family transcriptional regulator [Gemmatimonadota bacterium]|nr:TetR/AcrR family transcriptional regulator [Gemmatimonadota bacterium]MDH4349551.1 TetR/AcrR family transcriptional regulator [Gemmatimonadota bacterium]MDH5195717.1 TetR/AcrR family transcriptional regulator [Gemmatimonadota bacterium]